MIMNKEKVVNNTRLTIRLPSALLNSLTEVAEGSEMSVSELVRKMIEKLFVN